MKLIAKQITSLGSDLLGSDLLRDWLEGPLPQGLVGGIRGLESPGLRGMGQKVHSHPT